MATSASGVQEGRLAKFRIEEHATVWGIIDGALSVVDSPPRWAALEGLVRKFIWFVPLADGNRDLRNRWRLAGDAWTPPTRVSRWVRSCGETQRRSVAAGEPAASSRVGIEELWCEDGDEAVVRAALLDERHGLAGKLKDVADLASAVLMLTKDVVVVPIGDNAARGAANYILFRRHPDLSRSACHAHWRDVHAPMVAEGGGVGGYIQSYVEDEDLYWDGVAGVYFSSREVADQFERSDEFGLRQRADAATFIDLGTARRVFVDGDRFEQPSAQSA